MGNKATEFKQWYKERQGHPPIIKAALDAIIELESDLLSNINHSESIDQILHDPSTSFWLKEQIQQTSERDPVDALNDAMALVGVLNERVKSLNATNTEL